MTDTDYMRLAIDICRRGIERGQSPFGAVIVRNGDVIAAAHNHVWLNTDITAHAEVCAIRDACRRLCTIKLTGCDIYSTTEPCPMCFSAIHWAGMRRIVFGCAISDAASAGFSELSISNQQMKSQGGSPLQIAAPLLRDECAELFQLWLRREDRRGY